MQNCPGKNFPIQAGHFNGNHLGSPLGQLRAALMHDDEQFVGMIRAKSPFQFGMRMPCLGLNPMCYHWS